jgi:hypothetical protein
MAIIAQTRIRFMIAKLFPMITLAAIHPPYIWLISAPNAVVINVPKREPMRSPGMMAAAAPRSRIYLLRSQYISPKTIPKAKGYR